MVQVDNLIIWGSSQGELVSSLTQVLGRLNDVGFFVVAHKWSLLGPTLMYCGKICSSQGGEIGRERAQGLTRHDLTEISGGSDEVPAGFEFDAGASAATC